MGRILTCEQVSDGHPDKICDQVADAIVTDCLVHDKESRVAIECLLNEYYPPWKPPVSRLRATRKWYFPP